MSLQAQIQPYLGTGSNTGLLDGVNPDQTFKAYVESLLDAKTKGFSGTFVEDPTKQSQQQQSQGASGDSGSSGNTPTTNITKGLFSEYLGDGGGSDSSVGGTTFGSMGSGSSVGGRHSGTPSAASVLGAQSFANTISANPAGVGALAGLMFGPMGNLAARSLGPMAAQGFADYEWGGFNRGIDASMGAFSDAGMLGGLGTFSDAFGNVGTFSNQAAIDAYDTATFGTTGAGLAGGTSAMGPTGGISEGFDGSPSAPSAGIGAQEGFDGSPGGGGGGGKIVCTAMNQSYGFGSFRQAIWLRYSADHMTKEHEVGYHALFLPLVDAAYKQDKWYSKPLRKVLENIARHRTADIRAEMREGKRDTLGRVYRAVLEPLCYVVGKIKTL